LHLSVFLIDGAITPDLVNKSLKILKLALESPIVAYETVEKIDIEDAIVFIGLENHHGRTSLALSCGLLLDKDMRLQPLMKVIENLFNLEDNLDVEVALEFNYASGYPAVFLTKDYTILSIYLGSSTTTAVGSW
jgi:hypothetical protein